MRNQVLNYANMEKNKTAKKAVLFYKFLSSNGVRNYRFTVIVFLENHIQV